MASPATAATPITTAAGRSRSTATTRPTSPRAPTSDWARTTVRCPVRSASDPKNGAAIDQIGDVRIDIAYGGSCTAGKRDDIDFYARVMADADRAGRRVADGVRFYLQFGSADVAAYANQKGYLDLFARTGVEVIAPGCGACIGCGPGVSDSGAQVTVSAINRNYKGRSGPGQLYLASPLTV